MIRKASIKDVGQIHKLVNQFAKRDLMLSRSLFNVCESVRDFWVDEHNGQVLGCCALQIVYDGLAEIRSLAVKTNRQKRGIGRQLVNAAISEARQLGCRSVFVLTYIPAYFKSFKFKRINKNKLPSKIWISCINCVKFPDCQELALIKKL